jgi:hypothetical protein
VVEGNPSRSTATSMSVSEDLPRANSRRTSIVPGRGAAPQPSPQAETWPRRRCIPHPRPRVAGPMAETSRSTFRGSCKRAGCQRDLKTAENGSPTLRSQSSRSATPRVTRREQVARCTWLRPPSRSAPRWGRHGGRGYPFSDEADPLQASCTGLETEVDVKDAYGRRQTLAYQSQYEASPCNASWRGAAFSCDAGFRTADNPANHAPCTLRRP